MFDSYLVIVCSLTLKTPTALSATDERFVHALFIMLIYNETGWYPIGLATIRYAIIIWPASLPPLPDSSTGAGNVLKTLPSPLPVGGLTLPPTRDKDQPEQVYSALLDRRADQSLFAGSLCEISGINRGGRVGCTVLFCTLLGTIM